MSFFWLFEIKCSSLFDSLDWTSQLLVITQFVMFPLLYLFNVNEREQKFIQRWRTPMFFRGIAPQQDSNGSQKSNYIQQKGLYPVLDFTSCWSSGSVPIECQISKASGFAKQMLLCTVILYFLPRFLYDRRPFVPHRTWR